MKKLIGALSLVLAATAATVQAADGEAIYNQYCVACHASGIGPMTKSEEAWKPRLEAKGGVDGLLESAKQGMGAMPPKGSCMNCSDGELRAAIVHMISF